MTTTYPSPNTWTVPTITSSTNLGPLTTPFSAPPDCLQNLYDFQTAGLIPGDLYTYYTQGCAISSCCPSPTPYKDSLRLPKRLFPQRPVVGLPIRPRFQNHCHSNMDNILSQNTLSTEAVTSVGMYDVAYPVQIRWKAEDLSLFTTAAATGTTTSSSVAKTTSGSVTESDGTSGTTTSSLAGVTVAPTSTANSGGGGGGLTVGDQIAISISSALIGVAGAVLVAWLTTRWRDKEKSDAKKKEGKRQFVNTESIAHGSRSDV
ncbi:hypothetical protein BDZ45DRAFT_749286 [Acephala macrosclerotiorum]|nr:hypothetical protein BDZ45DRAFT_749286 [Acephala macrosclerotiorum]